MILADTHGDPIQRGGFHKDGKHYYTVATEFGEVKSRSFLSLGQKCVSGNLLGKF